VAVRQTKARVHRASPGHWTWYHWNCDAVPVPANISADEGRAHLGVSWGDWRPRWLPAYRDARRHMEHDHGIPHVRA
jgi:hypothetical protein